MSQLLLFSCKKYGTVWTGNRKYMTWEGFFDHRGGFMEFTIWDEMVDFFVDFSGMNAQEKEVFSVNQTARLIAALPFLADCEQAERTAYDHLASYLVATRKKSVSNVVRGETLRSRLFVISNFLGGDPDIIERGMNLLALNSLEDYYEDLEDDIKSGKYNPLSTGEIDYESEKMNLIEKIAAVECPEMDKILNLDTVQGFWV